MCRGMGGGGVLAMQGRGVSEAVLEVERCGCRCGGGGGVSEGCVGGRVMWV